MQNIKAELLSLLFIILSLVGLLFKDIIPYNLVTAMFIHGSLNHFTSNMMIFLMLSPAVEKYYGKIDYIVVFLYTAILEYIFHEYIFNVHAIGMSGFIFALFMLNSFISNKDAKVSICGILLLIIYGSQEISEIFKQDGISHAGHLLGLFTGLTYAWFYTHINKRFKGDANDI